MASDKRLTRSYSDRVIAGICGGLGRYFGIDPVIVRIVWLVLVLGYGTGLLMYLICWLIIPNEPERVVTPDDPIQGTDHD